VKASSIAPLISSRSKPAPAGPTSSTSGSIPTWQWNSKRPREFRTGTEGTPRRSLDTGGDRRPSILAVNLAQLAGLTLAEFLREQHCNIYTHADRLR
jgi:hypothetical protein